MGVRLVSKQLITLGLRVPTNHQLLDTHGRTQASGRELKRERHGCKNNDQASTGYLGAT